MGSVYDSECKSIMVIDNDPLITKAIYLYLQRKGYRVDIFHTGIDALCHLSLKRPDMMVLDLRLPDCDGWLIARLLNKMEWAEHVPVIIMSVLEADSEMMKEIKPFAFIQKPFDMGYRLHTIEEDFDKAKTLARI